MVHYFKVKVAKIVYSEEIISVSSDESEDADIQFFDENLRAENLNEEILDEIMDCIDMTAFCRSYDNHCDFNIKFFDSKPDLVIYDASLISKEDYEKLSATDKIKIAFNQSINRGD